MGQWYLSVFRCDRQGKISKGGVQKILGRISGGWDTNSHCSSANVTWMWKRGMKLGRGTTAGHLVLNCPYALNPEVCTVYYWLEEPKPLASPFSPAPILTNLTLCGWQHWYEHTPGSLRRTLKNNFAFCLKALLNAHESMLLLFWRCSLKGASYTHVKYMYTCMYDLYKIYITSLKIWQGMMHLVSLATQSLFSSAVPWKCLTNI